MNERCLLFFFRVTKFVSLPTVRATQTQIWIKFIRLNNRFVCRAYTEVADQVLIFAADCHPGFRKTVVTNGASREGINFV